jgi:chitinase
MTDCNFTAGGVPLTNVYQCEARTGYDGPTGVGTPIGATVFKPMFPTAAFTGPNSVAHGTLAHFDASSSSDPFPGGSIKTYFWTWGDGTTTSTSNPIASHTFATAGASTGIVLKVTDGYGRVATENHGFGVT